MFEPADLSLLNTLTLQQPSSSVMSCLTGLKLIAYNIVTYHHPPYSSEGRSILTASNVTTANLKLGKFKIVGSRTLSCS